MSLLDWLKTFAAIVLFVFFHYNNTHAMNCWRKWFLFLTWMVFLNLLTRTEAATETCSLKHKAVHEFRILAKFLKSTCEDFRFWEAADQQPATLLKTNLFRSIFQGFYLFFRNTYSKKHFWLAAFMYSTPV